MNWSDIISDPAFGNFLVIVIGLALIKLYEKRSSAATSERYENKPSLIISNGETKRKVDVRYED